VTAGVGRPALAERPISWESTVHRPLIAGLLASLLTTAAAAPRSRAATLTAADDLTVSFPALAAGCDAAVDLGVMRAAAGRGRTPSPVRRERVLVRLQRASGTGGFARLRAYLATAPGGLRVRVDGVLLSAVPQLVDANAPIGPAVAHLIEIEVPASEPPGAIFVPITWLADAS
jgi:hypothetical protein